MDLQMYDDPRAFRALADPFYGADTFRHTIALTVMARLLGVPRDEAPVMGTLHDNGQLIGVALRTPPWPVIVSGLPTDPGLLDSFLTRWLEADPGMPADIVPDQLESGAAVPEEDEREVTARPSQSFRPVTPDLLPDG